MTWMLIPRGLSVLLMLGLSQAFAATPTQGTALPTSKSAPAGPAAKADLPVGPASAPTSDAERIANANESIKQATQALEKLQKRLDEPDGEYQKAQAEFGGLNGKLKTLRSMVTKLRQDGKEPDAIALEATLPALQEDWQLAKDRFDIAIRQRKATQETIVGLQERVASDLQLLNRLEGKASPPTATTAPPHLPVTTPGPAAPPPADGKAAVEVPSAGAADHAVPGMPGLPVPVQGVVPSAPVDVHAAVTEPDPVVRVAREVLETRRAEVREVEARLRVAEEQVRVMNRSVQNAEKLLGLERESVAQAEKAAAKLSSTLQTRPPADPAARAAMANNLAETERRLAESRGRVQRIAEKVGALNDTLSAMKTELDIVAKQSEQKQKRVTDAEAELTALLSPTAPRNLFRWVFNKGPRILLIIVGMGLLHLGVRQFSRSIVGFITRTGQRGSVEDRENRASTLVGVFRYAAGVMVLGGGLVMLLDEVGVPIVPLMGGAAVVGLAVAFGAQNLIRDYFTGFMMLMEDQYSVNDVVRIGAIAGLVELITLRMTVLRDLEGIRHFIPHGTVASVSNLTHGWSRALLDIPVAYKENVDDVIGVLMQLGKEMRQDTKLGRHILEDPEMLGVDSLDDSGVTIRFLLKTRPLQQWPVKREMLRRIKNRFDELGIQIPYPHRSVYHHYPNGAASEEFPEVGAGRKAA
jgi:small-conductance mechanosensitive channel